MPVLYALLTRLLTPALLFVQQRRARRQTGKNDAWRQRLGWTAPQLSDVIWVHASSVGEVQAAIPVVAALRERYPDQSLLITTFTAAGRQRAAERFGANATIATLPWDTPGAVRRYLGQLSPRLFIGMETEIWPVLFAELDARGVPIALVSARLSESALRGYGRLRRSFARAAGRISLVAAQSRVVADRFATLGTPEERILVTGNVKFDLAAPDGLETTGRALRHEMFGARPVWLAASTREGEEALLLAAFQEARSGFEDALLVLAPRHPERADAIVRLCEARGMPCRRRSHGERPEPGTAVFLLDTLGELWDFYAACDLAFVGGSLVPVGGHNLLEPAALGVPLLAGPNQQNAPDISARLHAAGALVVVDSVQSLAAEWRRLAGSETARARMRDAALRVVATNRGAVARSMALLAPLIEKDRRQN